MRNSFKLVLSALVGLALVGQASAQGTLPNHSVPIGTGASGFRSVSPGTSGLPFLSAGASADPAFGALGCAGLPAFVGAVTSAGGTCTLAIASGTITFANMASGVVRERLAADRTYFVNLSSVSTGNCNGSTCQAGSNANAGTTIGAPFLTIQFAYNTICQSIDLNGHNVTVQLTDGNYTENVSTCPYVGRGTNGHTGPVMTQGNASTPTSVSLQPASGDAITATETAGLEWEFQNLKLSPPTGNSILADQGSWIVLGAGITFGTTTSNHVTAQYGSLVEFLSSYTVAGNANAHLLIIDGSRVIYAGAPAVTISGSPTIGTFVSAFRGAELVMPSATVTGAMTGTKWSRDSVSVMFLAGRDPDVVFQGSIAGSISPAPAGVIGPFTTGTNATYTRTIGATWIEIELAGGGGGGAGSGTTPGAAGAGGDTCFNTSGTACTSPVLKGSGGTLAATSGAAAAGGAATGGNVRNRAGANGGGGTSVTNGTGGQGGDSGLGSGGPGGPTGGAGSAATGCGGAGGGGGSAATVNAGGGGGGGGYVKHIINSPAATYTYTVGAAGAAGTLGTSGQAGGVGFAGCLTIIEHFN